MKQLKDPRDAAAVAAGRCTTHGCQSAPMLGYRKCELHHRQKTVRNYRRYAPLVSRRELKRLARSEGRCTVRGCTALAVKGSRCVQHWTPAQQEKYRPRVHPKLGLYDWEGGNVRWWELPEYRAVKSHLSSIKNSYLSKNATYAGMPFYEEWKHHPKIAATWILDNLGPRPADDYQLHIVDRPIGFIPGNLAWVPRGGHKQEELVNRLLIENQHLRARITQLEKERSGT